MYTYFSCSASLIPRCVAWEWGYCSANILQHTVFVKLSGTLVEKVWDLLTEEFLGYDIE